MKLAGSIMEELWFAEDDKEMATAEASSSLAAKLAEVQGLKTFPVVAQKVMTILNDPNFRVIEVTRALEEDPSLTAGVMRMANSAFFAGSAPVSGINQAFVRLGKRTIMEVVSAVATMGMFPDVGGIGGAVRDHCASVGALVQLLAREFSPSHTDGIFLSGLMHDIGKMLLIESEEILYSTSNIEESMEPNTMHLQERAILGYDHAVLAGHAVESWHLPDPIPKVIAWHHQPARAFQDSDIGAMVALLRIADQVDNQLRIKDEEWESWADNFSEGLECSFVGIKAGKLKEIWPAMHQARSDSLAMFSSA